MKRNLVGKILGKIKIFVQDFVPIRTALTVVAEYRRKCYQPQKTLLRGALVLIDTNPGTTVCYDLLILNVEYYLSLSFVVFISRLPVTLIVLDNLEVHQLVQSRGFDSGQDVFFVLTSIPKYITTRIQ